MYIIFILFLYLFFLNFQSTYYIQEKYVGNLGGELSKTLFLKVMIEKYRKSMFEKFKV